MRQTSLTAFQPDKKLGFLTSLLSISIWQVNFLRSSSCTFLAFLDSWTSSWSFSMSLWNVSRSLIISEYSWNVGVRKITKNYYQCIQSHCTWYSEKDPLKFEMILQPETVCIVIDQTSEKRLDISVHWCFYFPRELCTRYVLGCFSNATIKYQVWSVNTMKTLIMTNVGFKLILIGSSWLFSVLWCFDYWTIYSLIKSVRTNHIEIPT